MNHRRCLAGKNYLYRDMFYIFQAYSMFICLDKHAKNLVFTKIHVRGSKSRPSRKVLDSDTVRSILAFI